MLTQRGREKAGSDQIWREVIPHAATGLKVQPSACLFEQNTPATDINYFRNCNCFLLLRPLRRSGTCRRRFFLLLFFTRWELFTHCSHTADDQLTVRRQKNKGY